MLPTGNKFKRVKTLRHEEWSNGCAMIVLAEYRGKKFKFIFENNSIIHDFGFDPQHCIMVFNGLTWEKLADKSEIESFMREKPNYETYKLSGSGVTLFMKACEEYVKLIFD